MKALPWIILVLVALICIGCILPAIFFLSWIGRVLFIIAAIIVFLFWWKFFFSFLRQIPFDPPNVGIEVIKGKRQEKILSEGWYLMLPWWDAYTARLVNVQKKSLDIDLKDIRTKIADDSNNVQGQPTPKPKAGGEVSIKISVTWFPSKDDAKELLAYLNSGGEEGVKKILEDILEEEIRKVGHDFSWEEVSFNTKEIRQRIVKRLTGEELSEDKERDLANGIPVMADLGIKICRVNVGRVKEQGKLAQAAENKAVEEQERAGEQVEQDFVQSNVEKWMKLDQKISAQEAALIIMAERKKATITKEIKSYEGLDEVAEAFGRGVSSVFKKP